ncbi:MAG: S8 family peptidase [Planctomycetaceae bacterium]
MKSVHEIIDFLHSCLSGDRQNRRKQSRSRQSLGYAEAVEQRLLLTADLKDALYDVAVLQNIAADEQVSSYFLRFETAQDTAQLTEATGASSIEPSVFVTNGYTLDFNQGLTLQEAADAFSALPDFDYLHPNILVQLVPEAALNDTLYGTLWNWNNTGQGGGVAGIDVNIEPAWDDYSGLGVTIGIVDEGIETGHEDLVDNVNTTIDFDWNGQDNDPNPVGTGENHGTSVAGVAAARGNNNLGVAGAAYEAEIVGLRLIAGPVSDQDIAEALSHRTDIIDIYNNSWTPGARDALSQMGPQTAAAIRDSAINGRGGLGTIGVYSAGNGGINSNNNYSLYNNSRYTISVAALGNDGVRASYSTPGAVVNVTAPSGGGTLGLSSTDRTGALGYSQTNYANDLAGTSFSSPLVAGVIALMLEANPGLSYRDVADILAHTSDLVDSSNADWLQNGAGLWVNHSYGFGLINADAAVRAAETHIPLAPEVTFSTGVQTVGVAIPDNGAAVTATVTVASGDAIDSLEYVEVVLNADHQFIGDLEIILTSPAGTPSVLAEVRAGDAGTAYANRVLSTIRNWDESSEGTWTLSLRDGAANDVGTFNSFELRFYGTNDPPPGPVAIQSGGNTTVTDSGQTDTFDVVLSAQPASNVVLNVTSQDTGEVTVSTPQLTFTPANWDVPQTVTVAGVFDLTGDGNQITDVVVSVLAGQSDPAFSSALDAVVKVTSIDDDQFFPGKPVVTAPVGISPTDTPAFLWTSAQNATSYSLTITNVVTGVVVTQVSGLNGTTYTFPDPFIDGVYSTVVTAVNAQGQSNVSAPVLFAIGIPQIPVAPTVTAPGIGETVLTSTPEIRWLPVAAAFEYEVFARSGGTTFQETVTGTDVGNGMLGHTLAQAFSEGAATVQVRGLNALGQAGPWSDPVDFIVDAVLRPERPVITNPSVAVTQNAFPNFQWTAPGGNTYQLWVGKVPTTSGTGTAATVNNRVINLTGHSNRFYTHFIALRNGDYVAWVRSFNTAGEPSEWSAPVSFAVDVPVPATPVITNYRPNNGTQPTLEWATSGDDYTPGTTFHVWVNNLSTGQTQAVNVTGLTSNTYTFTSPLTQGRYASWVQATSAVGGVSSWSPRFDFTIDIAAPGRPTMTGPISPDGATTVQTEFPTFIWTAADNAATYDLWVNHIETGTTRIIREVGITGTTFSSTDALPEGNFRAWVRAFNSAGEVGEWSSPYNFAIDVPGPARPTITGPAPNAVGSVTSASPTVSWFALGGAASYNLQLQALPSNTTLIDRTGIIGNQFVIPLTLNEQSYQVRVQGVNSVGELSNWSDWYTFRVDVPNATTPIAFLPEGTVTRSLVTFQWQHSSDSVQYEILVRDLLNQESITFRVETFDVDPTLNRAVYSATLNDGTYRYWVRALNSQGTASAWSNSKAFVVNTVASLETEDKSVGPQIALTSLTREDVVQQSPQQSQPRQQFDQRQAVESADGQVPTAVAKQHDAVHADLVVIMAEFADPAALMILDEHQS